MVLAVSTSLESGTERPNLTPRERDEGVDPGSWISRQEIARWGIEAFVGRSLAIQSILRSIRLLQACPDTPVLITGETGTGKELVARALHFGSGRASKPFVAVNCAAIPTELADSVFFGHVKGAYTGATSDSKGCFLAADQGTVFLDEIGDLQASIQASLLRVLDDGVVVPVGTTQGHKVNVRVLAATNSCVSAKAIAGSFRRDLFYRLASFPCHLPPLRERREDIPLLTRHFAQAFAARTGLPCPDIAPEAVAALDRHNYPGNVRELKHLVEQAILECEGRCIRLKHLHFLEAPALSNGEDGTRDIPRASPEELPENLRAAEHILATRALGKANGNLSVAARHMGISRSRLYRLLADSSP